MRVLFVLLFGLTAVLAAPVASADLTSLVLHKLMSRAEAYDREASDRDRLHPFSVTDTGDASVMTMAGVPHDSAPRAETPQSHTSFLQFGPMEGRFGLKNLKTWYTAGSMSIKAELGYDGVLRLQADRPWIGGHLRFGFVDEDGGGSLRLEFSRNF